MEGYPPGRVEVRIWAWTTATANTVARRAERRIVYGLTGEKREGRRRWACGKRAWGQSRCRRTVGVESDENENETRGRERRRELRLGQRGGGLRETQKTERPRPHPTVLSSSATDTTASHSLPPVLTPSTHSVWLGSPPLVRTVHIRVGDRFANPR